MQGILVGFPVHELTLPKGWSEKNGITLKLFRKMNKLR